MTVWNDRPIGIDISHYNGDIDLSLAKAGGVKFVIAKCSDGWQMQEGSINDPATRVDEKFSDYCQQAWDNDLLFGAYHYFRPEMPLDEVDRYADRQFAAMKYAMGTKAGVSVKFIVIDFEEKTESNTITAEKIAMFADWCRKEWGLPVMLYSSMGMLNAFPSVTDLVAREGESWPMWMAQWIYTSQSSTWDGLKEYYPKDTQKVNTPGFASWQFWQWGVFKDLEGIPGAVDLNFWNGTLETMYTYFDYTPKNDPDPETPDPETPTPETPDPEEPVSSPDIIKALDNLTAQIKRLNDWISR